MLKRGLRIGGTVVVVVMCLVGIFTGITYATTRQPPTVGNTVSLHLSELQENYGIQFTVSSTNTNKEPISAQQALSIVSHVFAKPGALNATFGYMTINPKGNAVFVPPTAKAGQEDHGMVTNYSVWLVVRSHVSIPIVGPDPNASQKNEKHSRMAKSQVADYTFVDATNGQRFFTVTVSDK
jgi:hypothetical protein